MQYRVPWLWDLLHVKFDSHVALYGCNMTFILCVLVRITCVSLCLLSEQRALLSGKLTVLAYC